MTNYFEFKSLHQQEEPFLLGNVWNVQSAKAYEKAGYKALGTSSAAIAKSWGFSDGEEMSFHDYLFIIKRICASTKLPVSVDLESGYGKNADEIFDNILQLSNIGIVGINIEDSVVRNGERKLADAIVFSELLKEIVHKINKNSINMFVNVRTDVFLLNVDNVLDEAKNRIQLFERAAVDGLFLPCLTDVNNISELTNFTELPINLMAMPDLSLFEELKRLGVKRISSGNFMSDFIYGSLSDISSKILEQKNFHLLFQNDF